MRGTDSHMSGCYENHPKNQLVILIKFEIMHWTNAGFRLTCRLPHCRFDDDICSTAQAPLAAEG